MFVGRPDSPVGVSAVCTDFSTAEITWLSKFNGGNNQHFRIGYKKVDDDTFKEGEIVDDPGKDRIVTRFINNLDDGIQYLFTVYASNEYGTANLTAALNCTTQSK